MPDQDFNLWKSSSQSFVREHRKLLLRIIRRNCFNGHLSLQQADKWHVSLLLQIESEAMTHALNVFAHRSSFLGFYISKLRLLVQKASQQEDIDLLAADFNALVLKYKPLVEIISNDLTAMVPEANLSRKDLNQQILENLLNKKEKIREAYKNTSLLRYYLWSIIKNEAKNMISASLIKAGRFTRLELDFVKLVQEEKGNTNLILEEALQLFHGCLLLHLNKMQRLIICLNPHCVENLVGE